MNIDSNVFKAWENWVTYGLSGGSFAMAVIYNTREIAEHSAHHLIRGAIDDHFEWCDKWIPEMVRTPQWWGFEHMTEEQRMFLKLQCKPSSPVHHWLSQWEDKLRT